MFGGCLGFLKHQQYVKTGDFFDPAAGLGRSAYLADAESGDEIVFFCWKMGKEKILENVKREKKLLSCIQDLWNGINVLLTWYDLCFL